MRRGINIRKKKKIILKALNKKAATALILSSIILIFCFIIYVFFVQNIFIKTNLEKDTSYFASLNSEIPFSIKEIILFSSATAEAGSVNQLLSLDISQYCDIGIYLNTLDNTKSISSLYIDNISLSSTEIGTTYLYKKNIGDFGKSTFSESNIISDKFNFNIIDLNDDINYNNYEIYCDGSTPISIGFFNKNVKTQFIAEKSEILYNGTLLKDALIPLASLNCNISFTINIITGSNEHYICNVNFNVPFEDQNGTIYETGYVTIKLNSNETNKFIRVN